MTRSSTQRFRAIVDARPRGGIAFGLPFEPRDVWEDLDAYHVQGAAGGQPFRGHLTRGADGWSMLLGPAWCRAPGFGPGDSVEIILGLEGPRTATMGEDVGVAFAREPSAARFFDSLPSFYRKDFARWIDGAKQPATRAGRIAETVALATKGQRER